MNNEGFRRGVKKLQRNLSPTEQGVTPTQTTATQDTLADVHTPVTNHADVCNTNEEELLNIECITPSLVASVYMDVKNLFTRDHSATEPSEWVEPVCARTLPKDLFEISPTTSHTPLRKIVD